MIATLMFSFITGFLRGIAQSGSAPALGAGCREFESLYPDQFFILIRAQGALRIDTGSLNARNILPLRELGKLFWLRA
jgi:hypothetical protein